MRSVRTAALALIVGLVAASAGAQTVVQCKNNFSTGSVSSLATGNFVSPPASGHLIGTLIQVQGTTISAVTDTLSDSYTATPQSLFTNSGGSNRQAIYYAITGSSGTNSVTATLAGTSTYTTITACEISGVDTMSPFIDDASGSQIGTSITTDDVLALGGETSIILAIFESNDAGANSSTPTPFSGYTFSKADGTAGYVWTGYHAGISSNEVAGATTGGSDLYGILAAAFRAGSAPPATGGGCGLLLCGVGN